MNPNSQTNLITDCEKLLDLIPEYAFGVTDPEQTRLIEASLHACPEAVSRLAEYRDLQDELRAGVAQIEPPPLVGERLMAAIHPPIPFVAPNAVPTSAPVIAAAPRRSRAMRMAWVAAAAAVVALVLTNLYWLTRIAELTQSQNLLTTLMSSGQTNAFVLTNTDALHWVRLADPQDQGDASAFVMWNKDSKTGLLYARGFPQLEPNHIYHLWLRRSGEDRVFAGVFRVDEKGDGALLFNSPEPIEDFTWAGVTSESPDTPPDVPPPPAVVNGELNPA
ncbi:MAG: anti-sigma factor [Chloroflexota bacterium]